MEQISEADIALLRRFEPVAHFTYGEQFFPMDAERYIRRCALCVKRPNEPVRVLVPRGKLTVAKLTQPWPDVPGAIYYLHFVDPLPPREIQQFYQKSTLRDFRPGRGRLARVGILSRLGDLVFSVSLLVRGRVPGGAAAAAALEYQQLQRDDERFCYYGRVVREHGYVVLQYWYFYAFNDWRSSFNGVNDHEGDWEPVMVYLVEGDGGSVEPCWLAYSSHEFQGDDMRRRWDDPDIQKIGDHPVVFVAAGAHANYFFAGEYLPTAEVPFSAPLLRIWRRVRAFWRERLRQGGDPIAWRETGAIRIPFVDYARGDGLKIGAGQPLHWDMRLLQATDAQPAPPWVDGFRGLWGLHTGDPLEGEDAPARPKFNRDGTVNSLWYNAVGWCGLDKVPPPGHALDALLAQRRRLLDEQSELSEQIEAKVALATGLEAEIEAIQHLPHMRQRTTELLRKARAVAIECNRLRARRAMNEQSLAQFTGKAARLAAGDFGPPRAHLRVPQLPTSPDDIRLGRFAEVWSALSVGLLLITTILIGLISRQWWIGLVSMLGIFAFLEALFKRRVQNFISNFVVGLALLTMMVLLLEFFKPVIVVLALLTGLLIIIDNARELRSPAD
jgi:hypothetical protein